MTTKIKISLISLISLLIFAVPVAAGVEIFDACNGVAADSTSICSNTDEGSVLSGPNSILRNGLRIFVFIVGFTSIVMVMVGGFRYITSQGDPGGLASARQTLIYAIVGLVIALASEGILRFIVDRV